MRTVHKARDTLSIDMLALDSSGTADRLREQLGTLLTREQPQTVLLEMPEDYATHGQAYREVVLPYVILQSRRLGYRVRLDPESQKIAQRAFGRYLQGSAQEGYTFG